MFSGRLTQVTIRVLDWLANKTQPPENIPLHQTIGRNGEEDSYFYLRRLGYVMVARNYRSPHYRGEIDLIGWEKDMLCFIEVKSRTGKDVKPAEAAVDKYKQRELAIMAREYLTYLSPACQWRFDIVTVYYDPMDGPPQFELFRNALMLS